MGRSRPTATAATAHNNKPPDKSRVSSYQEGDDEFEMTAMVANVNANNTNGIDLRISSLDTRSNLLVSDESILIPDHTTENVDPNSNCNNNTNVDHARQPPNNVVAGGDKDEELGHFQKRYKPATTSANNNMDDTMDHTHFTSKDETTPTCTSLGGNGTHGINKKYAPFGTIYIVPKKIQPEEIVEDTTPMVNNDNNSNLQHEEGEQGEGVGQGDGVGGPSTCISHNHSVAAPAETTDPFSLSDDDDTVPLLAQAEMVKWNVTERRSFLHGVCCAEYCKAL